jgi:hypothetical protein
VSFRPACGKVQVDTFSKTMTFQPLKQERFVCMQLTKTETGTAKSHFTPSPRASVPNP